MAIRGGVACLGLWGAIGTCLAQSDLPSTGQALAGLEAFDAVMLGTMKQHDYPGGTLAVSYQGRLVLNKAYGYASKGFSGGTPLSVDQRIRIASMSKWITAAAALKAVELGRLQLDQPFAGLMGWSPNPQAYADPRVLKITLRHLLHNHAGWTIDRANDPMFLPSPVCPGDATGWFRTKTLDAEPGQLFSYANINFCLVQMALEKASGQSYADFVQTHIAQPLGITSWKLASATPGPDEPEYLWTAGTRNTPVTQAQLDGLGGAGAWTSSASDYVRFLDGLRGVRGKPLLPPALAAQMFQRPPDAPGADRPTYYGLGTRVRELPGGRFNAWHHGSLQGTSSFGVSYANGWSLFAVFNRRVGSDLRDAAANDLDRALGQAMNKSGRPEGAIKP